MKHVICTEKPSVARTFAEVLGVTETKEGFMENDEWIITWCVGHLISLAYPESYDEKYGKWVEEDLPFLPSQYLYGVIPSVAKQFRTVKNIYNRSDIDMIYYAGDPAREGIYIQALVRNNAGHNPSAAEKVVWIDSQTRDEILRGIREAKPFSEYANLIASGYERAIEDYATGINLSRILTLRYGQLANRYAAAKKYRPIAVGRVMTCVLGMIVNREREIENFKVTPFYKIISDINGVKAEWKAVEGSRMLNSPLLYSENGFKAEEDAQRFINTLHSPILIEKIERKMEKKAAPLLFNLAELQSECTKRFKISPAKTLEIAQTLYEAKLTTYPRTDARVLSSAIAGEIEINLTGIKDKFKSGLSISATKILESGWHKDIANTKYTDDSKVTDHYAIIPTGTGYGSIKSLNDQELAVYELIVRRFLSIFFPPAEYDSIKVTEKTSGERFFTSTKVLISPGYLSVAGIPKSEEDDETNKDMFFELKEGEQYQTEYSIKKGETTPPKRYTSGSMILAMENAGNLIEDEELRAQIKGSGIGTSATRAEVIQKLIASEYILVNNKTQILSPAPLGNIIYEIVLDTVPALLNPKMTASWEKGLAAIADGQIKAAAYRKIVEEYISKEVASIKGKSSDDEGLKQRLSQYKGKNSFADFESKELDTACPICGKLLKTTPFGYVCVGYDKNATDEQLKAKSACKFSIGQISGRNITESELADLITKGKTKELKGFKGKNGKAFSAALKFHLEDTKFGYQKPVLQFLFNEPERSAIPCPKCKNQLVKSKFSYNCSCGYKISHTVASKEIPEDEILKMISTGRTSLLAGFKSKKGKSFKAYVIADKDGNTSLQFPDK